MYKKIYIFIKKIYKKNKIKKKFIDLQKKES